MRLRGLLHGQLYVTPHIQQVEYCEVPMRASDPPGMRFLYCRPKVTLYARVHAAVSTFGARRRRQGKCWCSEAQSLWTSACRRDTALNCLLLAFRCSYMSMAHPFGVMKYSEAIH
jgi:hypothetical protein